MKDEMFTKLSRTATDNAIKEVAKLLRSNKGKADKKKIDKDDDKLIKDIKSGKYDNKEVEIERRAIHQNMPMIEIVGGTIDDNSNIENIFEQVIGGSSENNILHSNEKQKIKVKDALKRFAEEDIEKRIDMEELKDQVINNVENNGIVFIDEIDKIVERNGIERGDVSRQGVQRDILPIIEGSTVMTSLGPVKTDHILFIAAGAFTQSSPSDMMPELQGRFPIRVKLKSLDKKDFVQILTNVEYNLLDQYKAMLATDGVKLDFTKTAIEYMSDLAVRLNDNVENIGARRLATIVEDVLRDILYEAPYNTAKKEITIDADYVKKVYSKEIHDENLDKFIL